MGFVEGWQQGRAEAIAKRPLERNAPPRRPPMPAADKRHTHNHVAPAKPVYSYSSPPPIKLGYFNGDLDKPIEYRGERSICLCGLNGAGKSTRFLIELMMTTSHRNLFVFDIKAELAYQTMAEREKYSDVWLINPYRMHGLRNDGFAPLIWIRPDDPMLFDKCAAISAALVEIATTGDKYWTESARGLLTALLMFEVIQAAGKRKASLLNVRMMLTEADAWKTVTAVVDGKTVQRQEQIAGLAYQAARMIENGNKRIASLAGRFVREHGQNELTGIQSTADTATQWMLAEAFDDLDEGVVDFARLRNGPRPVTIYVLIPAGEVSSKRPLTRLLVSCALTEHLVPGRFSTLFVLDEFRATVGSLQIVSDMWSLIRGFGAMLMPILQSIVQIQHLQPKEWEVLIGQSGMVATLGPPGDLTTAKFFSERSGTTTVLQAGFNVGSGTSAGDGVNGGTASNNGGGSVSQGSANNYGSNISGGLNFSQVERRAVTPQELMDLPAGAGRIWLPGLGSHSIPFFAPNYWRRREPWVARVKPNPLRTP